MTAPEASGPNVGLLAALGDKATARTRKAITGYLLGQTVWRIGKTWWDKMEAENRYTVAVPADDDIYPDVHAALLDLLPTDRRRALTTKTGAFNDAPVAPNDPTPRPSIRFSYDGTRRQTITLRGHRVKVDVEKPDLSNWLSDRAWRPHDRIILTARDVPGRDAVVEFLEGIAARRRTRKPRLWAATTWGEWHSYDDVPVRPLSSVVLRGTMLESMVDDLTEFLSREADYGRLGVPWHRGFLFHGPPGCGKSSVAKALAGYFRLDTHFISLAAVDNDAKLGGLVAHIRPRSLLVLEDIDIVHGAKRRDDDSPGVTLAGLLNVLDGFLTPHGLVTVLTTNDTSVLDPALTRPGRVDRSYEIGPMDVDQMNRLTLALCGASADLTRLAGPVTPAEVVDIIKRTLGSPGTALDEIKRQYAGADQ